MRHNLLATQCNSGCGGSPDRHYSVYEPPVRSASVSVEGKTFEVLVANIPLRVCIVDDDDAVRDSLRILLDAHGIGVESFATPALFLRHAGAIDADCLIFDLHMPEMTGLELAEKLRARRMTTPVIILTGRSTPQLAQRMERAGVTAVLAKPVSDDELMRTIQHARTVACTGPGCH
jgi:FixJ family two-component response regulator